MNTSSKLGQEIIDYQRDHSDKMTERLKAAERLVQMAVEQYPDDQNFICAHDKWLEARLCVDEQAFVDEHIEKSNELLEKYAFSDQCKVCISTLQAKMYQVKGEYQKAEEILENAIELCMQTNKFWKFPKMGETFLQMIHVNIAEGSKGKVLHYAERHDKVQMLLIRFLKEQIKNKPNNATVQEFAKHSIQNAEEAMKEVEVLEMLARGEHKKAMKLAHKYLKDVGDGDTGFARVMHSMMVHLAHNKDWLVFLEAAEFVQPELEKREHYRWLAQLIQNKIQAHTEWADQSSAQIAKDELEAIRPFLLWDNL